MNNAPIHASISFLEDSRFGKKYYRLKNGCLEISRKTDHETSNEIYYLSELSPVFVRTAKRHYSQIIRFVFLCVFFAVLIASLIIRPENLHGIFYTLATCCMVVASLLFPILYFISQKTEVVQFQDKSGIAAFEIIKERKYAEEFDAFISALQKEIEEGGTAPTPDVHMETGADISAKTTPPHIHADNHETRRQSTNPLTLSVIDITDEESRIDLHTSEAQEATPGLITGCIRALAGTRNILRLGRNADEWLEVGWINRGFVFRENLDGVCYYSNSPIKDVLEAANFVAEYQNDSVCEPKDWFRVNGGQATYDFVENRLLFELKHKRYPVTSTWAQCLYVGVHVVLAFGLIGFAYLPAMETHGDPIALVFATLKFSACMIFFMGAMMLKFDFREPRKKSRHSYNCD